MFRPIALAATVVIAITFPTELLAQVSVPLTAAVGASRTSPPVPNNAADVTALKTRLRALGFSWVPDSDEMDTLTIHTIKLFQSIVRNRESVGGAGVDGIVDVNGATHVWLQRSGAPKWQLMPSHGDGFKNFELVESVQDDHDFGTDWLAKTIVGAGSHYQTNYRSSHAAASLIEANDASRDCGRDTSDHAGHETGSMVDIRLPKTDGTAGGITVGAANYDRNATRAILQAFHNQPNFERARLNDATLAAETITVDGQTRNLCVQDASGTVHDNHIHVDIKPPQ